MSDLRAHSCDCPVSITGGLSVFQSSFSLQSSGKELEDSYDTIAVPFRPSLDQHESVVQLDGRDNSGSYPSNNRKQECPTAVSSDQSESSGPQSRPFSLASDMHSAQESPTIPSGRSPGQFADQSLTSSLQQVFGHQCPAEERSPSIVWMRPLKTAKLHLHGYSSSNKLHARSLCLP